MPIPFLVPGLIAALSAAAATTGVVSGVKAVQKNKDAKYINEDAQTICKRAEKSVEKARNKSQKSLEILGQTKLRTLDQTVSKFISEFEKIHSIQLKNSAGLNEIRNIHFDKQEMAEMRKMSLLAGSVLGGVAGGAGAGALAAFGAYGATMTFATASTGTAIASLSGAAATNATLAFLGGGALAAGGGGMALGSAILSGAVAGPAIAVLGVVINASASKNLDSAYSNRAQAREYAEGCSTIVTLCDAITARANMFTKLLKKTDHILSDLTKRIQHITTTKGFDFTTYSHEDQEVIAMALSVAKAVKQVLDTPILDNDGNVTKESKEVFEKVNIEAAHLLSAEEMKESILEVFSATKLKERTYRAEVQVLGSAIHKGEIFSSDDVRYGIISIHSGDSEMECAYDCSTVTCELLAEKEVNPSGKTLVRDLRGPHEVKESNKDRVIYL